MQSAQDFCTGSYLRDELHVTVLNTVMNHLDVVAGTLITNPVTACLTIALGGDALEDILDWGPCRLVTTRHQRGTVTGTLLTTRYTGADEVKALVLQVLSAAVGVGEVRVTTVNDDVASLKQGQKGLDPVVDSLASLDKEHDTSGLLELGDELLGGVSADNRLALGLVGEEAVHLGNSSVKGANGETVVGHVQDQVLTPTRDVSATCREGFGWRGRDLHNGQTDEAEISTLHMILVSIDSFSKRGDCVHDPACDVRETSAG